MAVIGIDVSKAKLNCLWIRELVTGKVKSKIVKNDTEGFLTLLEWSRKSTGESIESIHFVMEATGIYHEALAYALHQAGAKVSIVNPAHISHYAKSLGQRSKTDHKDSWVIAHYGATHPLRSWQPEPDEIRTLKALIARYQAVCEDTQRERNRLEKAQASQASVEVLTSIDIVLKQLSQESKRLEQLINQHIDQNPNLKHDQELLHTIPGIGSVVSRYMISVIRSKAFVSASQCAAFLGLVPVERESGSSVRGRPRLSKAGNPVIRAKLYMAAVVSIRYNPDISRQYQRLLANGKSKMSALGAAMRKLVHICFGVLKHQKPYQAQWA